MRLTASLLVAAINDLPRNRDYRYVHSSTRTLLQIVDIVLPEGPIYIRRYNPSKGDGPSDGKVAPISTQMISRVANAFLPGQPINFDRVLGASYNTRSAFESLLAHTPQFYACYPGRIDSYSGVIKRGHKHLLWCPEEPHGPGVIEEIELDLAVSEIPTVDLVYDSLSIPDNILGGNVDIHIQRQHARIQVALVLIGLQLGYSCWVAQNDRGICYKDQALAEMEGVVDSLYNVPMIAAFDSAAKAALLIDCIWFQNHKLMPAVMEIEHTTGVESGLARMQGLRERIPAITTRYVVVAPDEDRHKVIKATNKPQFQGLDARYFPYSAVEELLVFCSRRGTLGITDRFLDNYMEKVIE